MAIFVTKLQRLRGKTAGKTGTRHHLDRLRTDPLSKNLASEPEGRTLGRMGAK